jgi:hypothetical protein
LDHHRSVHARWSARLRQADQEALEMTMRRLPVLLLLCIAWAGPAHALRCGTGVVSEGDSTLKLLHTCGEPTLKEQTQRQVSYDIYDRFNGVTTTAYDTVLVEIWTYNFGPRRFVQRITIEEGKIKSIESAGYGY